MKFSKAALDRGHCRNVITAREMQIVNSLICGATAREVADELRVSFHTVRTHIKNVYAKLGIANRIELLKWCVVHGSEHGSLGADS